MSDYATRVLVFALITPLLLQTYAHAETKVGFRQLGSITPVVVQRGKKTVANIRSSFTLDGTHSVFFDRPGITAKFLETKPIKAPRRNRASAGTPFRFEFDVPSDQPLGIYELRVATKTAVSSVTHLLVTDFPVIEELPKRNNNTLETAQDIAIPAAVSGLCERTEDVDHYQFRGQAGEIVTFNVYAQRVTQAVHLMQSGNGSYHMDAILTLFGPYGQIVAQVDNYYGGDPFLAFEIPEDGTYTLQLRDTRYKGNAKYVYCIEVANKPFAHAVFPMVVQQGASTKAEISGYNLGDTTSVTLTATDTEETGWKQITINTSNGSTNPIDVKVSPNTQILSTGTNIAQSAAQSISLPCGINGRIMEDDPIQYFSFQARKGRYYAFEVEAHRHGSSLDSHLKILDKKGKKLGENDDSWHTKDSVYSFKAPADGTYFIELHDAIFRGGESFYFHLSAMEALPDFELTGEYYYAQIAPGTRMIWFAKVNRLNGFSGPIDIVVEGLPAGVTQTPVTIPPGMTHCAVILNCADDAPIGAALVEISGQAFITDYDGEQMQITRQGRVTCELQNQGGGQGRWPIHTQIVGVTEPLDLQSVTATPEDIALKPGEKKEISVTVKRNPEYQDPITIAMDFKYFRSILGAQLPPGVTVAKSSTAILNGKKTEAKVILEATRDARKLVKVERLPIAVLARVSITFSITTNYASNPIYLTTMPDGK